MCRGAKKLPVNGGGERPCPFCHGTGENKWYERNVVQQRRSNDGRRQRQWFLWAIALVLWILTWAGGLALAPISILSVFFTIGMGGYLFATRQKTPWAQDSTAFTVIVGGLLWARRNHHKSQRSFR